jgi:hypothetical protein
MNVVLDPAGVQLDNWGQFAVRKGYTLPPGTYGYVIQTVERSIDAQVVGGPRLTTSADVEGFTSEKVKHASGIYSEIFPIVNGVGPYEDLFSGGAILRYEKSGSKWYADDDPATHGTIRMIGRNRFFPSTPGIADRIVRAIRARTGVLTLEGVVWTISKTTPAAGLPYNPDYRVLPGDSEATHEFEIRWTSDGGVTTVTSNVIRMRGGLRKTRGRKKLRKYTRKAR